VAVAGAKPGHADDAASPKEAVDTSPSLPKPKDYVYVTISTPQGKKLHKYEVTPKGNVFVEEVPGDQAPPDQK
jgi:hypothetical protein